MGDIEKPPSSGLYIWHKNTDAWPPEADIIAVQGLGARPYSTWTYSDKKASKSWSWTRAFPRLRNTPNGNEPEKRTTMWLKDLLPNNLFNVLVASFAYESYWRKSTSASMQNFVEVFLQALLNHQAKWGKRPLVLIGHSFGGLVIQQALVTAILQGVFSEIRLSVCGIIFLGVPFQGSDAATIGQWLTQMPVDDERLVRLLRRKSTELGQMSRHFWHSYSDLDIVYFYETLDRRYGPWKIRVVDVQSATLLGKRRIPLSTHHAGLNKFSGPADENYQLVLPEIERMVQRAPTILIDVRRRDESTAVHQFEPCSMVPFEVRDFEGREDILRELDMRLDLNSGHHRVALVGEGGIGKTAIAIEFAVRLRRKDPRIWVFWVHASSAATIKRSYRMIAKAVKIRVQGKLNADIVIQVSKWLKDYSRPWLMIVDNITTAELLWGQQAGPNPNQPDANTDDSAFNFELDSYVPQGRHSAVLATTRDYGIASTLSDGDYVEVEGMTEEDAEKLLGRIIQDPNVKPTDLDTLATEMGCSPLAMTQAAAAISECDLAIGDYLERFRQFHSSEAENPITIKTGMLSYDFIEELERKASQRRTPRRRRAESQSPARDYLSLLSFLDSHGTPRLLLADGDPVLFMKAMILLRSFRLVDTYKSGENFEIHPFVQKSTKDMLNADATEEFSRKAEELVAEAFHREEFKDGEQRQQLRLYAEALLAERGVAGGENESFHRRRIRAELERPGSEQDLDQDFSPLNQRLSNLETQIQNLVEGHNARFDDLGEGLENLKREFQTLIRNHNTRFSTLDERLDGLGRRFDELRQRFDTPQS